MVGQIKTWPTCPFCLKEVYVERMTLYPCCFGRICVDCICKMNDICGECLTKLPPSEEMAHGGSYLRILGTTWNGQENQEKHYVGKLLAAGYNVTVQEMLQIETIYKSMYVDPGWWLLVSASQQNAICSLKQAANRNYVPAMINLGEIYENNRDYKDAEKWYSAATLPWEALAGTLVDPVAYSRYGMFLHRRSSYVKAREFFAMAAEMDHMEGQYWYAKYLLNRTGLSAWKSLQQYQHKDTCQAIRLLLTAISKGLALRDGNMFGQRPAVLVLYDAVLAAAQEDGKDLYQVGASPLPRLRKMLLLHKENNNHDAQEIDRILETTLKLKMRKCANCGEREVSLKECSGCYCVSYCSKLCQKEHYKLGHRQDCCNDEIYDATNFLRFFPEPELSPWVLMLAREPWLAACALILCGWVTGSFFYIGGLVQRVTYLIPLVVVLIMEVHNDTGRSVVLAYLEQLSLLRATYGRIVRQVGVAIFAFTVVWYLLFCSSATNS